MIGFEVTVRCPFHDAPVEPVAVGDPEGDMSASSVRCTVCRSVFRVTAVLTAEKVRFGFPELQDWIHRMRGLPLHNLESCGCMGGGDRTGVCASVPTIAVLCRVNADTAQSWKKRGLREDAADKAATALGVHPMEIWPDAWAALTEMDLLDDMLEDAR